MCTFHSFGSGQGQVACDRTELKACSVEIVGNLNSWSTDNIIKKCSVSIT